MNMRRRVILALGFGAAGSQVAKAAEASEPKPHRVAIQVSTRDPQVMTLALNNAVNVSKDYAERAEDVEIEIVAYGPGLHMLREDTSPVKDRLTSISKSMSNIAFSACGNTQHSMEKAEGKPIVLLPVAKVVTAGVVRLMELQEQGWSYIRP